MNWLTRRRFLQLAAATAAGGVATVGYTWFVEPEWLEFTRVRMPVKRLPTALQGRTLVQLSDIHVGPNVSEEYVRETFRRVQAMAPDIVVYTGDLTSSHRDLYTRTASAYATMPRGTLATVGVLGNHDYGINWGEPAVARAIGNTVRDLGMQVMTNDVAVVEGLQIVGMGDLWAHQFDPARAFSRCDPREPSIVLSHNPDSADLAGWGGYDGWILSGHTHGGQCKPPFLPPPIIPVQNKRYTAGEFALSGGRRMYISRGVGTVLPVRFNVRPEVTVFELAAE